MVMEMPVVEVGKYGVWLVAKNVRRNQSIKKILVVMKILVEEDAKNSQETNGKLFESSSIAGEKLYQRGDYAEAKLANLDVYLSKKVGLFPDVLERKVAGHLEKGDYVSLFSAVSALVTGEFYAKGHFPGFGRPFVFYAEVLLKVGRNKESKDAVRTALKSPWWTLGCRYQAREAAEIAGWEDEQIEYLKEKVSEEGRLEDLKKGKAPAQVALDQAAFLLDLASLEGTWDETVEQIAECYNEAGLDDIARFVMHSD
ncbi:hypothetical protein ACLOJK_035449 [Asimina triloba]